MRRRTLRWRAARSSASASGRTSRRTSPSIAEVFLDLVPGSGARWIGLMLSKPAIELGNLLRPECQLRVARGIVQARPERHRELGSVACRELQEFREGVRRHAPILPLAFA